MKALAILTFLVGMTVFLHHDDQAGYQDSLADVVATNYLTYRACARRYVADNTNVNGDINTVTIDNKLYIGSVLLPNNFRFINNRTWHTYVNNKICYIYGGMSIKEINAVKRLLNDSYGVGFASNGYLVDSNGGTTIALPEHVTRTQVAAGQRLFVSVSSYK